MFKRVQAGRIPEKAATRLHIHRGIVIHDQLGTSVSINLLFGCVHCIEVMLENRRNFSMGAHTHNLGAGVGEELMTWNDTAITVSPRIYGGMR